MRIKITPSQTGNPPGKVAEAEIHFDPQDGVLSGMKLIGFGVWQQRNDRNALNVTFPARQYTVNGERRSFALMRPISEPTASGPLKDAIIDAYRQATDTPAPTKEGDQDQEQTRSTNSTETGDARHDLKLDGVNLTTRPGLSDPRPLTPLASLTPNRSIRF